MECTHVSDSAAKYAPLSMILRRRSAFGNETGKLGIGEYW